MGGLREARKNQSRAESRLDLAGDAATAGYDKAMSGYSGVAEEYRPYMDVGKTGASALQALFSDPSSITKDPFYQEREKRQLDAVQTSAAAKGKLFGGQTLLELMKTGGEFASAEFDRAAARYATAANMGMAATGAYDAAKANVAEMEIGKGNAGMRMYESKASLDEKRASYGAGMFSSWFGGSGPFGQATGGSLCYIAAYHFGHATPEHYEIAMHVRNGKTWRARLARLIYAALHPLFKSLLAEARKDA